MAYALKVDGKVTPLSHWVSPEQLLANARSTINFEQDQNLKGLFFDLFSTSKTPTVMTEKLHSLLCCLPKFAMPKLSYDNVFRVIVMQFFDAYNFDIRPIKKTCIHIVQPDGRIIPFDTMNLLYRDEKAQYVEKLRAEQQKIFEMYQGAEKTLEQ